MQIKSECCIVFNFPDVALDRLKVTNQVAAHRVVLSKSIKASGCISSMFVPSLNKRMLESTPLTMSFMKRRKRRSTRIDPWGTPALI